jgi:hypothetical protein
MHAPLLLLPAELLQITRLHLSSSRPIPNRSRQYLLVVGVPPFVLSVLPVRGPKVCRIPTSDSLLPAFFSDMLQASSSPSIASISVPSIEHLSRVFGMADTIHGIFQWWMSGAPLAVRIVSFSCVRPPCPGLVPLTAFHGLTSASCSSP